ncbi:hypothetical protein [Psychrobacillus sp. OK032]|uniref:phage tail assembly chaperone n=1 Tax=Psychrobacillus sp. OK032 TaxID=1884358 RepID=UPI0008BEC590|nr:hypothetical protein [Psychrobacillus sp. OK032]SER87296.1 Phage XkdN-like tail assembly chaperone protein, TAC [Psychrobacillus sp. OK032]
MAKMNALEALLGATTEIEETIEMPRLNTEFKVRALTGDHVKKLSAEATVYDGKNGNKTERVDQSQLSGLMLAAAIIEPNFSDAALLKHYGARDGADCIQKALLAGEIAAVTKVVLNVSGLGDATEIEAAKN